ncbi:MAG: hypothetical protein ABR499_07070 [Gemmatimonadaceae bacterium]
MSTSAARSLLAGAIDYAGLFPPASLPMREAVRNYAAYRVSPDAWALGHFVVPIGRLAELRQSAADLLPSAGEPPWHLSAIVGSVGAVDCSAFGALEGTGVAVDAVEVRVRVPEDLATVAAGLPRGVDIFYEFPVESDPAPFIAAIRRVGGNAKVRTGGVTADAFPSVADLARFIVACARSAVPFKATAGLHHPFRALYRLTYAPDSPTGEMFGFVNVLLAAALARAGTPQSKVAELLGERDTNAVRFSPAGADWRGHRVSADSIAETRGTLALSFGSCSFREPLDELRTLGLL